MSSSEVIIAPIDRDQERIVQAHTADWITKAECIFERTFDPVEVRFDLIGSTAGMFRVSGETCHIRYNPWLFAKYFEENLVSTVPHEVAHYIVHRVYGRRRTRPHGEEWRALMRAFAADATVTCNFDMAGIPRRLQQRHKYRCDCMGHELSTRRHNLIVSRRAQYVCRRCNSGLRADFT